MENKKVNLKEAISARLTAVFEWNYLHEFLLSLLNAIVFYMYSHHLKGTIALYICFIVLFSLKIIAKADSNKYSKKNILSAILLLGLFRLMLNLNDIPKQSFPFIFRLLLLVLFQMIYFVLSDVRSTIKTVVCSFCEALKTVFDLCTLFAKTYWPSAIFFLLSLVVLFICIIRRSILAVFQGFAIVSLIFILYFVKERVDPKLYLRKAFFYSIFGFCAGIVLVEHTFTESIKDTLYFACKVFMLFEFAFLGVTVPDLVDALGKLHNTPNSPSSAENKTSKDQPEGLS